MTYYYVFQNKSFIRKFYPKCEWSDTLELIGFIFLTIIFSVAVCELDTFCIKHLRNLSEDVSKKSRANKSSELLFLGFSSSISNHILLAVHHRI
jgi:hypothetical protein